MGIELQELFPVAVQTNAKYIKGEITYYTKTVKNEQFVTRLLNSQEDHQANEFVDFRVLKCSNINSN